MSLKRSIETERDTEVDGGKTGGGEGDTAIAKEWQGLPGATGSWEREERACPCSEGAGRAGTLVSDSQPPICEKVRLHYFEPPG